MSGLLASATSEAFLDGIGEVGVEVGLVTAGALAAGFAVWAVPQAVDIGKRIYRAAKR